MRIVVVFDGAETFDDVPDLDHRTRRHVRHR
jgi:hypothetical protein